VNDKSTDAGNESAKNESTKDESTKNQAANAVQETSRQDASTFDWVTERSSCSLPKVFNTLRLQIEEDVKTRNALRPTYAAYEFSLTQDTAEFKVLLKAKEVHQAVTFTLADHAIQVRDDQGSPPFEITVIFDDHGICRLNVNGEERDVWQVRRMALENLMFRGL
jgi:hypothetical protein